MDYRRGVANSTYALLTSTALITGLMLLSFSGNPYSLIDTPQSGNNSLPDTGDTSLPGNTSVNASDLPDQNLQNSSMTQNQDLITKISKKLFELVSQQQLENTDASSQNTSNTTQNDTELSQNQTETTPENNTAENTTDSSQPENQTQSNQTETTSNSTGGNQSNKSEDAVNDSSGNQTFNETDFNQSMPEGNNSDSEGLLGGLAKSISELFGSDSQPGLNETESTQNQTENNPENTSTEENVSNSTETGNTDNQSSQESGTQQGEENRTQSTNDNNTSGQDALPGLKPLLYAAALLLLTGGIILFYRSGKNPGEFMKTVFKTLKSAVLAIPDLFKRIVVKTISTAITGVKRIIDTGKHILKAPVEAFTSLKARIKAAITNLRQKTGAARNRTVKQNLKLLLTGKDESLEGLDQIWIELKKKLKLENETSITPAEVRAEAVRQKLPEKTVNEIVDAFRKDKYSSRDYPGELNLDKWREDLEGDEN